MHVTSSHRMAFNRSKRDTTVIYPVETYAVWHRWGSINGNI